MNKVELDKIDRKILEVLQNNGRLTNLEVAERVNLSPSPCLRRIRRLEESGVIRQYAALLDPSKIGPRSRFSIRVQGARCTAQRSELPCPAPHSRNNKYCVPSAPSPSPSYPIP